VRKEIRIVGVGGQGVVWAADLIARAALLQKGVKASVSVRYGAEMRGGFSKADVVVSDEADPFPWVTELDALVTMSVKPLTKSDLRRLKAGAPAVVDSGLESVSAVNVVRVPAIETSRRELGSDKYANSVMVGYLSRVLGLPSPEHLKRALLERTTKSAVESNLRALELGLQMGTGA